MYKGINFKLNYPSDKCNKYGSALLYFMLETYSIDNHIYSQEVMS